MIKSTDDTKLIVVHTGSERDKIVKVNKEPYWYTDRNGYYVSAWKEGSDIEILQVEAIGSESIAYEYRVLEV